MSKGEKRYFRLQNSKYSFKEKPNFIKLFEYLDSQKSFDEANLKNNFSNQSWIKNLAFEKYRLYHLLLSSLVMYEDNNTPEATTENLLVRKVEILFNKKLFEQCSKLLKKTKAIAIEKEYFLSSLRLSEVEAKLAKHVFSTETIFVQLPQILEERQSIIEKYLTLNKANFLLNLVLESYGKRIDNYTDEQKQELAKRINPKIKELEANLNSESAKTVYYRARTLYCLIREDHEVGYKFQHQLMEIIEARYKNNAVLIEEYMTHLYNVLVFQLKLNKQKELKETRARIQKLEPKISLQSTKDRFFLYCLTVDWEVLWRNKKTDLMYKSLDETVEKLPTPIGKHDSFIELNCHYNVAYLYFIYGDYDKAESHSHKILEQFDKGLHMQFHASFRLLNILCHYELGNYKLLAPLAKSAFRFLKSQNQLTDYNKEILNFMKTKFFTSADNDKFINRAIAVKQRLLDISGPENPRFTQLFDLPGWLESKIDKRSFLEIIKEH